MGKDFSCFLFLRVYKLLGPLFFLMYINSLTPGLSSTTKLFADEMPHFSVAHDVTQSTNELNDDLEKLQNWVYHWKISFKFDEYKQAQEVIFSLNFLLRPSR